MIVQFYYIFLIIKCMKSQIILFADLLTSCDT